MVAENVTNYATEKLKEVLLMMQYLWEEVIQWVDTVFPPDARVEKFNHWVQVGKTFLVAWLVLLMLICCFKCCCKCFKWVDTVFPPEARVEKLNLWVQVGKPFMENVKNYATKKLKEVLVMMQYLWEEVIQWVDTVFPPEARVEKFNHWVQVGKTFLVAWLVLLILMYCCKCWGIGRRGRPERMMRAPVRNYRMPRNEFERNPGSYFRNLRARNR
ncbi:hypothetical protein POM88_018027 [Heracleum sosnowskyi]|uniref:Uncharacterized protein n=1 Tax=Heracleum sosnowskyi TaxID=360622 RepID=A0AAD8IRL7_9APIA|nr:hypothetical protein POM88_018027 [Heracleum sosnowskyi]